jgi:hypothetical protein
VPVEAKPLFRPDVLRPQLAGFRLPDRTAELRLILGRWAELLGSTQADSLKEQEILPDFLSDVFCQVLGYTRAVDNRDLYTFSREKYVEVDGKFADAVLGELTPTGSRFVVAVEGKGPKDPLDRPFAGRKMSAVDQGYRYAINLPCDWVIVTSMRQTRLYYKGADQYTFERFDIKALATDEAQLKKFLFLLGTERVIPASGQCHLYPLLEASEKVGKELTKEFYVRYANMREDAFTHLCQANPEVEPQAILSNTQKLLDRILFCSFCEDRGLLPTETILRAYEHTDPYNPRPIWENFRGLFRAVNLGNTGLNIPAYNGGLFADDPSLDCLNVPDEVCRYFQDLASYDYRPPHEASDVGDGAGKLVDVDILGHIFEQSISDLERLRNEIEGLTERQNREQHFSRRKKEGAFYTPAFITRYIVGEALGRVLDDKFESLRLRHAEEATGTARRVLANPRSYDVKALNEPQTAALNRFWQDWQDELARLKVLDPSCGSGAFLIEAFEQLYQAYERSNDRLEELRGQRSLFDLDRQILQNNLYGVDLNEEAIEICRLSLWIKTAQRGKPLTSLDHSIRVGNSVVADPSVHPRAFDWQAAFPEVFERGGFDVVVGNPPYVRQEWISAYKPYFQASYKAYHGTADLYVYFYELGLNVLTPGGRLSFIVTNKWMKAAYGEPLRRFFAESSWLESVIDFGHAKQIFEDADVFPSIIVARRPADGPSPESTRVCAIPREQLRVNDLNLQISAEGVTIERSRLASDAWSLEPKAVHELIKKIRSRGVPIADFGGVKPFYGVKTGFNDAFLIDSATRNALISEDPRSATLIKPYLRGQDIKRWTSEWVGLWMIFTRRGIDIDAYPAIKRHLSQYRDRLEPKPKGWSGGEWNGRKPGTYQWFETQDPVEYWSLFESPKLVYQDITWRANFCLDKDGTFSNNTVYFLPTADLWILAVLNSPIGWWFAWREAQHGKDEALRYFNTFLEGFPIPKPSDDQRESGETYVNRLITLTKAQQATVRDVLDWLRVEHEILEPSTKLRIPTSLDSEAFVAEVKKVRGKKIPLTLAALRSLREEHERIIVPAQAIAREAQELERAVSDLVNEAYGLTPHEDRLMWDTAPPRMPIAAPSTPR